MGLVYIYRFPTRTHGVVLYAFITVKGAPTLWVDSCGSGGGMRHVDRMVDRTELRGHGHSSQDRESVHQVAIGSTHATR